MSAEDVQALRVLMAEFRGEVRTNLAEIRGDMRVVRQQSDVLAEKVDRVEGKVEQMRNNQPGFVTKAEVDRRLRNGTAIVGTPVAVLTLIINFLFQVLTN
ncbi:hypothetical protein [Nocardiopsis sp. SBT366]|uniref:hypothetical protein n=1 Tax=Nocardiopsis sp. SBT366 TaxID=1580529 RepID=UPI00066B6097|nr:hypothetical protein [Nocardiopsis sp. SBT366]